MASIANLAAKVTANAAQFDSTMERVGKQIGYLQQRIQKVTAPFTKLRAVVGLVAATLGVAYIHSIANAGVETLRFARLTGTSVDNIFAFRDGLRQFGISAEESNDILGTLVKTIASAANGNAALRDSFKRLGGINFLADLSKSDPVEAFKKIANAISSIADPATRAAFATQIFGDKATSVIAALSRGDSAIGKYQQSLSAFGYTFKNIDISKIENAQRTFDNLQATFEKLVLQIATELAPWLSNLAGLFEDNSVKGKDIIDVIMNIGKAIGYVYIVANNMIATVRLVFESLISIGETVINIFLKLIKYIVRAEQAATKFLGLSKKSSEWKKWGDGLDRSTGIIDADINERMQRSVDMFKGFDKVDEVFNSISRSATNSASAINTVATAGGALAKAFANAELYKRGLQVTEENQSGLDKYNTTLMELDKLLQSGSISWETYAKAIAKATNELESAYQLHSIALPSAQRGNTSAAFSSINRSTFENQLRTKETPQQRLERLQKQANEIAKQQLEQAKIIAEATKNRTVVSIN